MNHFRPPFGVHASGRDRSVERNRRRRPVPQGAVRSHSVVVIPPAFDQDLRLLERVEDLRVQQLVPQLAVERLDVAVLPRAAGLDKQRLHAPSSPSHFLTDSDANSLPLSERMCSGMPRARNRSARAWITSLALSLRSTRIASDSRVYSSTIVSIRNALPSCVRSITKS